MTDETTRDLVQHARARLEAAAQADDATRLEILEDLYRTLEAELEGTRDQTGAPGS